jgi:hypothetical protein
MADPNQPPIGYDSAELVRLQSIFSASQSASPVDYDEPSYNPYEEEDYDEPQRYGAENFNDQSPARLTDVPTSSTNVKKPRTVAAGYDPRRNGGTLTVMFRDGTLWNYYGVSKDEWIKFHSSISKGNPYINKSFLSKPQGLADLSGITDDFLSQLQLMARVSQFRYKSRRATIDASGRKVYGVRREAQRKSQLNPRSAASKAFYKANGVNPSKGGKPPKRK